MPSRKTLRDIISPLFGAWLGFPKRRPSIVWGAKTVLQKEFLKQEIRQKNSHLEMEHFFTFLLRKQLQQTIQIRKKSLKLASSNLRHFETTETEKVGLIEVNWNYALPGNILMARALSTERSRQGIGPPSMVEVADSVQPSRIRISVLPNCCIPI